MPKRLTLVVAATAVLSVPAGAFAQQSPITAESLKRLGYEKHWDVQLDLDRGGRITRGDLLDDVLYLTTDKGDLQAVDASTGLVLWWRHLTESVYEIFPPSHFTSKSGKAFGIYTTSTNVIIADRTTGESVADMAIPFGMAGTAVANETSLFFGSADGHFYAFLWLPHCAVQPVQKWLVRVGGPTAGRPVFVDGGDSIVFASQAGILFSCTSLQRVLHWSFETGGPVFGDIQVTPESVYAASMNRSLYSLSTLSGVQKWRQRFSEPLRDGPVLAGGVIYQHCPTEGIWAIDAETGTRLWHQQEARRFVCRTRDRVFLADDDEHLMTVASDDGSIGDLVPLRRRSLAIVNAVDETLFLATPAGALVCAKPDGTPQLTLADLHRVRALAAGGSETTGDDSAAPQRPSRPSDEFIDPNDPLRSMSKIEPLAGDRDDTDDPF